MSLLLAGVAGGVLAMPAPAVAQQQVASKKQDFAIPAGTLKNALDRWTRQAHRELVYREADVADVRSKGVSGVLTPEDALMKILEGTGFGVAFHDSGAIAIVRQQAKGDATPEILVTGKRIWSLNTGIERTEDDSQPFIVFDRDDIERSGAPDLDTFLRNQLNVNAAPSTSDMSGRTNYTQRGLSNINLRGLGSRDTLILVDGRRQPGINLGLGQINQAQITGIPMAAVERIEVLASSASGIYGSGASGGVINIILRRDYEGAEISANYADTYDFAQHDFRIDFTGAKTIEGGRTNISLTASWRKQDPLLYGDRSELLKRGRDLILANDPAVYYDEFPPSASTPNIRTSDGSPLSLDPEYGGTQFDSPIAYVPAGYRGVAQDGVDPLIATIGNYNFEQPDSAAGEGLRAPLLYGTENLSGMLAVRREFNDWLSGYVEGSASRAISQTIVTRAPSSISLLADAPNNPFAQTIEVSLPQGNSEAEVSSRNDQRRGVVGAIAQLPFDWQAAADFSWARSRYTADKTPSNVVVDFATDLGNGSQDVLRDLRLDPLDYTYIDSDFGSLTTPATTRIATQSLRLAGPVPFDLPGGKPRMTVNLERSVEVAGSTLSAINGPFSSVTYTPSRKQTILAAYAEIAFPIFAPENEIPLMQSLELRVSARHERYKGEGALANILCGFTSGALPSDDIYEGCPPEGTDFGYATTENSHTDPSISVRWSPIEDVTFRGSYTTGYLPPTLDQLTKLEGALGVDAGDPLRGGERIGSPGPYGYEVMGFYGGNPDVKPETSKTWTVGVILTPRFLSGLRFSADWTRITKDDNYFSPNGLLFAYDDATEDALEIFLERYPNRVVRGPASDGYDVGPITSIDVSLANLVGSRAEAVDFALDYSDELLGGTIDISASATWVRELSVQTYPGQPAEEYDGVNTESYGQGYSDNGALRWRGNGSVRWTKGPLSISWQGRYVDSYYLQLDRAFVQRQGSAKVDSVFYHDVAGSYEINSGLKLRAGINNVLGTKPPIDTYAYPIRYSRNADPRLTNFYLSITKSF